MFNALVELSFAPEGKYLSSLSCAICGFLLSCYKDEGNVLDGLFLSLWILFNSYSISDCWYFCMESMSSLPRGCVCFSLSVLFQEMRRSSLQF